MKQVINGFILLAVMFMLGGCSTQSTSKRNDPGRSTSSTQASSKSHTIQVISFPSGAQIEWRGKRIGKTPVKIEVDKKYAQSVPFLEIKAEAEGSGCSQTKQIPTDRPFPIMVHFNMHSGCK